MRFVYLINQASTASPFNRFTHTCSHKLGLQIPEVHFSFGAFVPENQREIKKKKDSRETGLRERELRLAEQSKVEAGVVYCFRPSVPNNLCKQGRPILTRGTIIPLFTEAVAPLCPHQWGWWIDVWGWYLIKLTQLHNRRTCLGSQCHAAHTHTHQIQPRGFTKRVTWSCLHNELLRSNCGLLSAYEQGAAHSGEMVCLEAVRKLVLLVWFALFF